MIDMDKLVKKAAELFNVTAVDIYGLSRNKEVVQARWAVAAAALKVGMSTFDIGAHLNRDYTTIVHARETIGMYLKRDPIYAAKVPRLYAYAEDLVSDAGENLKLEVEVQRIALNAVRQLVKIMEENPQSFRKLMASMITNEITKL